MPVKPFLTPEFTSEEWQCRTLITPNNKEWLGVFNSALLELLNQYNWEQVETSDLTIDQAIALCEGVLTEFFATEECAPDGACLQPSGSRVLRLGSGGSIQQLANGAWEAPTDEYALPPTPERDEPTVYERRCMAAANAENVLAQVYEMVSDMVAAEANETEIMIAVAALVASLLGLAFGFVLPALVGVFFVAWEVFLEIAAFMTEDLWDAAFSDSLRCILFECANDDGNVVTFDWNCVNEGMAAAVNPLDPTFLVQVRLFGQVSFMLNVIGAEGLNAAGATTEVVSADCEECGEWCYEWDLTLTNGGFAHIDTGTGNWVSGTGWVGVVNAGTVRIRLIKSFPGDIRLTHMDVRFNMTPGTGTPAGGANGKLDGSYIPGMVSSSPSYNGTDILSGWAGDQIADQMTLEFRTGTSGSNGTVTITKVLLTGYGDNPFGEDNCEAEE